jgi:hypothetical protein
MSFAPLGRVDETHLSPCQLKVAALSFPNWSPRINWPLITLHAGLD